MKAVRKGILIARTNLLRLLDYNNQKEHPGLKQKLELDTVWDAHVVSYQEETAKG